MTIAAVRTHRLSAPLHTPFVTALRRTTTVDTLVVELVDDDGRSGYGEAPQVWQVTGSSVAGAKACVEELLAPMLVGRSADDLIARTGEVQRAAVGNESAKAAVDVALHDLAAQRLGVPLVRLLGGSSLRVPTDVTLSAGDAVELVATAKQRQADGFTVLKLKVGTDAAGDLDRVRAVRAAVGPTIRIRLDANQGWTPREAVRVIRGIHDAGLDVELVEQPVPAHDLLGLAHVRRHAETSLMADESVSDLHGLVELIRHEAADLVNLKLAKAGGITPNLELARVARQHGLGVSVGCMLESHVGVRAAAALAAEVGCDVVPDLDGAWWLAEGAPDAQLVACAGGQVLPGRMAP